MMMTMIITFETYELVCFVASNRIWIFIWLHCLWNAARDCEDMMTIATRIARWREMFRCEIVTKFHYNRISVYILQLLTIPPPLLRRLWRLHCEGVGRELNAAGRGAERSHGRRDVSCVRLEREVLGVRWEERSMSSGAIWLRDEHDGLRYKNCN